MFANFIAETCTIVGDVVTLLGAVDESIEASEAYTDGQSIYYTIEDTTGPNKVTGTGIYNANNTITRTDTWSWNGTVYDTNPVSNITLDAGTHTIRVSITIEALTDYLSNVPRIHIQLTEPVSPRLGDMWIPSQGI